MIKEIEGILYQLDSMDQEDDAKSMVSGSVPASVELMADTGLEVEDGIQHENVEGEPNQNQVMSPRAQPLETLGVEEGGVPNGLSSAQSAPANEFSTPLQNKGGGDAQVFFCEITP